MPEYVIDPEAKMEAVYDFELEIEYTHNLKELYKRLHFWLEDGGWMDLYGRDEYEVRYWQRNLPGDREEHHIWWRAWKNASTPMTKNEFFKYFLRIDYQTINSQKKEIMHQGKKWKINQTNTILRVKGFLILDWQKGWKENGFLKSIQDRFTQWIYKKRISEEKDNAMNATIELQNHIKDFLEVRKDQEINPNIYPPNMLPR